MSEVVHKKFTLKFYYSWHREHPTVPDILWDKMSGTVERSLCHLCHTQTLITQYTSLYILLDITPIYTSTINIVSILF